MKAECKHCSKTFFRPTSAELGQRMNEHLEKKHQDLLKAEIIKAQLFIGFMVTRHFNGVPDIEADPVNALLRQQLVEMIQGTRVVFDDSSLNPPDPLQPEPEAEAPPPPSNVIEISSSDVTVVEEQKGSIDESAPAPQAQTETDATGDLRSSVPAAL